MTTMSTASTAADTRDLVGTLVRPAMADALGRLDPGTRRMCAYHLGFTDVDGRAAGGSGKGVRPELVLLSARAVGGSASQAVPAAVAVELVHNFSLVHDDVMDGDAERRHRPTVWAAFGRSEAILAGDDLLALAAEILAESASGASTWAIRCLMAATRRLVAGQLADVGFETRADVSLGECLQMARDKTGALLACAASIGAVLADGPAAVSLGLAAYGEHLGLAYQLDDDLLGIWGDPAVTGKPVRSDLRAGKKSLPVVAALGSGAPAAHRLAELYLRPGAEDPDEALLEELAGLVEQAGGRRWAAAEAESELARARSCLDGLGLEPHVRRELADLADRLCRRDH